MRDNTIDELVVYRRPSDRPRDAIRVIFKTGHMAERTKALLSAERLFSLVDINISSPNFITNWIQMHPRAASVLDNLVDPPLGSKVRLTQRVSNLVQAAEVYHRLFHTTQNELPTDEHAAVKTLINKSD